MSLDLRRRVKRFLYDRTPGLAGRFPYFGVAVHFPPGSHIFHKVCDQGIFEQENVRFLYEHLRPGATVFDVGANIGLMAIPLLRRSPDCRVVSFEPSPNTHPFVARTAQGSEFAGRWVVRGEAVGDRVGEIEFHVAAARDALLDGIRDTGRAGAGRMRKVTVPITTLDRFWDGLGRPPVSAVKIDVEGAELPVLRGGSECLRACRPAVLVEWNRQNLTTYGCDPNALLTFGADVGYQVFAWPGGIPVTTPAGLDIQMLNTESFVLLAN